jgi:uncharacterized protein
VIETEFISAAKAERERERRRRGRLALLVPASVTVLWLVYVTAAGQWERVLGSWPASATMLFGSFVGGSTPQGSGAIAFPVFTKVLEVPSDVARSFSLSIQTIGMGSASLAILIRRQLIEWRAVALGGGVAAVTFLVALYVIGDPDAPYWPSTLPGPYVRVTFSLLLAAMALVVYLGTKVLLRKVDRALPPMNGRLYAALVAAGVLGGVATALTGSGIDVLLYLFIVVLFGLDPRVGVPSCVVVMAAVSVLGVLTLGVLDGQLSVILSEGTTGTVVAVGGDSVTGRQDGSQVVAAYGEGGLDLPARRFDLFGLWLAAVPVAAWMGMVGAWAASRMKARDLVRFVIVLAVAEVVSTAIFLDELHSFGWLAVYGVVGLVVVGVGLYLLARYRRTIFRLPGLTLEESLSRGHLDVVAGYERQLAAEAAGREPGGCDEVGHETDR